MRTYLFLKGACRLILGCFFSFQLISEREKKIGHQASDTHQIADWPTASLSSPILSSALKRPALADCSGLFFSSYYYTVRQ